MFQNQVVVITGGSSGAGKELAGRLAARGANLALVARDREKLAAVKHELAAKLGPGRKIGAFSADVTDPAAVEKSFRQIAAEIGTPEILINSAGILYEGYFEKKPLEIFRETMDINFFGTIHSIRAALPFFRAKGEGRIVNICSMAGLMGIFGYSAYCASKHAVAGLTHSLRQEFKPLNIRLHLVCPGEFDSPMVDRINTYRSAENRAIVHMLPTMTSAQVADAVIRGVEKGDYLIIPGAKTRLVELVNRLMPGLSRYIVDRQVKKVCKSVPKCR